MSKLERLSAQEIGAESATALPTKEVRSLLDLNAAVDLALDLAARWTWRSRATSTSPRRSRWSSSLLSDAVPAPNEAAAVGDHDGACYSAVRPCARRRPRTVLARAWALRRGTAR